jgi:hypothetical protein
VDSGRGDAADSASRRAPPRLSSAPDPDAVDCALRLYAATSAFAIARPRHLLDALRQVFPDAEATLTGFGVRL